MPVYCIDTSSILEWFVRRYSPAILPGLPSRMEGLIEAGRLRAPKIVFDEIRPGDDVHAWAKEQDALFIEESVSVQLIVRDLMAKHHDPARPLKGINNADPFVIAMAIDGGRDWTVVSDEHPGSAESRKIPFVCAQEGVRCVTFQDMMKTEGWQFF